MNVISRILILSIVGGGLVTMMLLLLTTIKPHRARAFVPQELRKIAQSQRYLNTSILIFWMTIGALIFFDFDHFELKTIKLIGMAAWGILLFAIFAAAICLFQLIRVLFGVWPSNLSILVMVYPLLIIVLVATGREVTIPSVLFVLYPTLNLILLLGVNGCATDTLRRNGIPVGFFGVKPAAIKNIRDE